MNPNLSLKELRADPRQLVRLINNGYSVDITGHRRVLARTKPILPNGGQGNAGYVISVIKGLEAMRLTDASVDTTKALRLGKTNALKHKYSK